MSFASRITLIKSMMKVIPTYNMMNNIIHKVCIKNIH